MGRNMHPAHLIEHARQSGVVLALNDDRLTWSASQQPPPDLLALLRDNKPAVIEHLRQQQRAWLERVAALLNATADDLLARGLIDLDDLTEQYRMHPRFAARLIETSPAWLGVSLGRGDGEFREQYAPAREAIEVRTQCVPPDANKGNTPTRENSASNRVAPEWIAARDAFHSHAVGNCKHCYPPASRYCPTGLDLLARYQRATQ